MLRDELRQYFLLCTGYHRYGQKAAYAALQVLAFQGHKAAQLFFLREKRR